MDMFPIDFKFPDMEYPSLYDEGESPAELLQSIDNKMDNQDKIIENQKIQIANQQKQIDFAKEGAESAKKDSRIAKRQARIAIVISVVSNIAEILITYFTNK